MIFDLGIGSGDPYLLPNVPKVVNMYESLQVSIWFNQVSCFFTSDHVSTLSSFIVKVLTW